MKYKRLFQILLSFILIMSVIIFALSVLSFISAIADYAASMSAANSLPVLMYYLGFVFRYLALLLASFVSGIFCIIMLVKVNENPFISKRPKTAEIAEENLSDGSDDVLKTIENKQKRIIRLQTEVERLKRKI